MVQDKPIPLREAELPDVMSVPVAARYLGVGRNLAYEMIRDGRLGGLRLGRRVVVPKAALLALLASAGTDQAAQRRAFSAP